MKLRTILLSTSILLFLTLAGYLYWRYQYCPQIAEKSLQEARGYLDSDQYALAAPYAQRAVDFFPERFEAQEAQALVLLGTGTDTLRALYHLGKAYALDTTHYQVALLYARISRKLGNSSHALTVLNRALILYPDSASLFFQRAITLAALSQLDSSYSDYMRAMKLEEIHTAKPLHPTLHEDRMGDYASVISALAKHSDPSSTSAEAYAQRGLFRIKIQDYAHAIPDLCSALKKGLSRWDILHGLSQAHMNLGNLDSALTFINQAINLSPTPDSLLQSRALIFIHSARPIQAVEDLNKLVDAGIAKANTYYLRGIAFTQLARNKEAIQDYNTTIRLRPTLYEAYFNRGLIYAYMGDFTRAIDDYNVIIAHMPKYSAPVLARGVAYINLDNFSAGCADFQRAANLGNAQGEKMIEDYCVK